MRIKGFFVDEKSAYRFAAAKCKGVNHVNIGLVLSGGMAKGAYQVGVLKALQKYIPADSIKYFSCASIGALNGYAYAINNLELAEDMWINSCSDDSRMFVKQIIKRGLLKRYIAEIYGTGTLNNNFYVPIFDPMSRKIEYINLKDLDDEQRINYLKASVAMPVLDKGVKIDGNIWFDGAIVDNIPVYPLLRHRIDYLICVYFDDLCYSFENAYFDNKIVKVVFPDGGILKQSVVIEKAVIKEMISEGYEVAESKFSRVFFNGYEDVYAIYRAIEKMNMTERDRHLRITGDMVITNINKITQKISKRKIKN